MICDPCTASDHCGEPGRASASCPCQHRSPGTGQPVTVGLDPSGPGAVVPTTFTPKAYVYTKIDVAPELIADCRDTDDCCSPPETCRLDAARAALGAPVAPVPADVESAYPVDPTAASDARLADLLARWTRNREASA